MDADERALFADAVTQAVSRSAPERLVDVVRGDGWAELCADDEAIACGVLFEQVGAACSSAPVLDLAVETLAPGARPTLCAGTRDEPAATDGETLHVSAIVLGDPTAVTDVLVGFPERGNPDGRVVAVPSDLFAVESVPGLDPDLYAHRVRADVPLDSCRDVPGISWAELVAHLRRCLGHMLVGLAEGAADLAREHVMTRTQFGRPLGSWQTVAHRLADVHVDLVAARATLDAAWADRSPLTAAVAKAQAGAAAIGAVDTAQQLFGAIGFTWEHAIHRSVRRVQVFDAALASSSELVTEVGALLLADRTLEPARVDL